MCCCQSMQRRWCCRRKTNLQAEEQDNSEIPKSKEAIADSKANLTSYNDNSLSDEEKEYKFDLFSYAMNKQVKEEKKT
jgi:hypothetical protein